MAAPSLIWNGDDVKAKVLAAAEKGIDKTMAAAVRDTKGSHPGWKNITGLAEGSVRIGVTARPHAWKDKLVRLGAEAPHVFENGARAGAEWNPVVALCLHPLGGDRPYVAVHFIPSHQAHFA